MTIRGIRNKNPGNIDRTTTTWRGMAKDQSSDPRFVVFESMEYGCRAIFKCLQSYRRSYHLTTIRSIINRWAPACENNTRGYCERVSRETGVGIDDPLPENRETYIALAKAIVCVECTPAGAAEISDETWEKAADMAGM